MALAAHPERCAASNASRTSKVSASSPTLDPFQLASAEMVSNPYPVYHRLRAEAPVYWSDAWNGWVVTRYDDVHGVLLDQRFSSARTSAILEHLPESAQNDLKFIRRYMSLLISTIDDPEHARQRTVALKALAPRLFEAMRPQIQPEAALLSREAIGLARSNRSNTEVKTQ